MGILFSSNDSLCEERILKIDELIQKRKQCIRQMDRRIATLKGEISRRSEECTEERKIWYGKRILNFERSSRAFENDIAKYEIQSQRMSRIKEMMSDVQEIEKQNVLLKKMEYISASCDAHEQSGLLEELDEFSQGLLMDDSNVSDADALVSFSFCLVPEIPTRGIEEEVYTSINKHIFEQ
jgi:hypothetical protein